MKIFPDGKREIGTARTGLSRTDVTDAVAAISDPNVGFRFDLDYRTIDYGIHTLAVLVGIDGQKPLLLARRDLVVVDRAQDRAQQIADAGLDAAPLSSDKDLSGALDGPITLQSVFYNPLVRGSGSNTAIKRCATISSASPKYRDEILPAEGSRYSAIS